MKNKIKILALFFLMIVVATVVLTIILLVFSDAKNKKIREDYQTEKIIRVEGRVTEIKEREVEIQNKEGEKKIIPLADETELLIQSDSGLEK